MIRNVALNILTPDDWMFFIRFEELCNIFSSCIDSIKLPLVEYTGEMSLNSCDSGGSKVVTKDPKR